MVLSFLGAAAAATFLGTAWSASPARLRVSSTPSLARAATDPEDAHWWDGFGDATQRGLAAPVADLEVFQGSLYAGGDFNDNTRTLQHIGRWDGSRWQPLEAGVMWGWPPPCPGGTCATWVSDMVVYNGSLIAGGRFNFAGRYSDSRRANNIARWDGTRWYPLGSVSQNGVNDQVFSLAVYGGELIASGLFTEAGGMPVNYIARWNGREWRSLAGGFDSVAYAMVEYQGDLIAAGRYLYRWDGTSWSRFSDQEFAGGGLIVYHDSLYANIFHQIGGFDRLLVSKWNGSVWEPVGDLGYDVYDFESYGNRLVATGDFWTSRPGQPRNIARWDGIRWEAMGSGIGPDRWGNGGWGTALEEFEGSLYVGGDFVEAGGKPSFYIARWDDVITAVVVEVLEGAWTDEGVRLSWRFAPASLVDLAGVHVERAGDPGGPFETRTGSALEPAEAMTFFDPGFEPGNLWYRLRLVDWGGASITSVAILVTPSTARGGPDLQVPAVASDGSAVAFRYRLARPYGRVDLAVYTAQGRVLRWLVRGPASPGDHVRFWDLRTDSGTEVPRGVYFVRLAADGSTRTRKVAILHH